jgi:hypothetical protein
MGFFKKKADPISARSKALNAQIAALEAEIKKLDGQLQHGPVQHQSRSTHLATQPPPRTSFNRSTREPIFEPVDHRRLEATPDDAPSPDHFNDLGVRKYDLAAAWRRWRNSFRSPPASNPKLVTYLAAGSIKGLRPLRYEKRIARNRLIALFLVLLLILWGVIYMLLHS